MLNVKKLMGSTKIFFPVYNKKIIGLDSHLKRLQDGLDAINIKNPHSKDEWIKLIHKVISFDSIHDGLTPFLLFSPFWSKFCTNEP